MNAIVPLPRSASRLAGALPGQPARALDFVTQPTVRTGRLVLRKLKPEDQYRIALAMQDIRIVRMLTSVHVPYSSDDALDWIRSFENGDRTGWAYAVTFDGGALEGVVTIEWREAGPRTGWHISCWLMPDHWDAGYIREASVVLIERFFGRLMGETLFAAATVDNPAALHVLDRLGFQVTGGAQTYSRSRGLMVELVETEVTFGSFMPA